MDDRRLEALAEQKKQEAQEEYAERRQENEDRRGLPMMQAIRIAGARAIASWAVDFTIRFGLDPHEFMGTVVDAYANRIRDEDEDLIDEP